METVTGGRTDGAAQLLQGGWSALSDGRWDKAADLFGRALSLTPSAEAYAGMACVELRYRRLSDMAGDVRPCLIVPEDADFPRGGDVSQLLELYGNGFTADAAALLCEQTGCAPQEAEAALERLLTLFEEDRLLTSSPSLERALALADPALRARLEGYLAAAEQKKRQLADAGALNILLGEMEGAVTAEDWETLAGRFAALSVPEAAVHTEECRMQAGAIRAAAAAGQTQLEEFYGRCRTMEDAAATAADYFMVMDAYLMLEGFRDSAGRAASCRETGLRLSAEAVLRAPLLEYAE